MKNSSVCYNNKLHDIMSLISCDLIEHDDLHNVVPNFSKDVLQVKNFLLILRVHIQRQSNITTATNFCKISSYVVYLLLRIFIALGSGWIPNDGV